MKTPELIIFDLDGTLLDTLSSLARAFNSALVARGFPVHPEDAFRTIIGNGATVAAQRCLPKDRQSDDDITDCVQLFQSHYDKIWQTATAYPDIENLLSSLQGKLKLAVLSNKDDHFTRRCVDHFFPDVFHYVLGHRADIPHKPNPEGGNLVINTLGVAPGDTWLVGDTATDMNTATACKVLGVGVLWGFRDRDELVTAGANRLVDSPLQILDLME